MSNGFRAQGGGAVKLTVAGTLRLDGKIDAEGGYYGGRSTGSWSGGGGRAAVLVYYERPVKVGVNPKGLSPPPSGTKNA